MKSLSKLLFLISFIALYKIEAQYTVKKDTIAGTAMSMTMDSRIENLLSKQEDACSRPKEIIAEPKESVKINVPSRNLTNNEICKQNPKIMGYKIQVALVKSNEEARQIGADFRKNFPTLKVEIDASLRPNYKILAGSYFNKQSAASDLSSVKSIYNTATAVQYRIFCVEAK